jgi:hypothetical protein
MLLGLTEILKLAAINQLVRQKIDTIFVLLMMWVEKCHKEGG